MQCADALLKQERRQISAWLTNIITMNPPCGSSGAACGQETTYLEMKRVGEPQRLGDAVREEQEVFVVVAEASAKHRAEVNVG